MENLSELREINDGLRRVETSVNHLRAALLGDEFNKDGVINRVEALEKKFKRLDKAFYVLLGSLTLGAYPMWLKISEILKPFVNSYFR